MPRSIIRAVCLSPLALCLVSSLRAQAPETRPLTLEQAVGIALRQNPDYLLARLDEQKARQAVQEARSPFVPQITVGSGLAFSNGFPLSIAGSAPSIVQAYGTKFIYNRPQSLKVREAGEMVKAAGHAAEAKAEEVAYRVAATYLDFERATRAAAAASRQLETVLRIETLVGARVQAGRDIPMELTRARVESARARAYVQMLQAKTDLLEETLRADLGLGDAVRIQPVETALGSRLDLPATEDAAVSEAVHNSRDLKRLESILQAKRYQAGGEKSAYYPRIDLVAQYAMLGRFNNYEDFFRTFQRHNGQLGMSFQLPILAKSQVSSRVALVESEIAQTKLQLAATLAGVTLETRRLFREVRQAESAREVARLELDLARESLSVNLARFDEGRVAVSAVEQARVVESQKWEAFYDLQTASHKARLALLRQTGTLIAALK